MTQQTPQPEEAPGPRCRLNATQPLERLRGLLPTPLAKPANVEFDTTPIPKTKVERRRASSFSTSLDQDATLPGKISAQQEHGISVSESALREETVLYLAYGSNLASQTFRGMRGIKPLSQICVFVPELQLTFDLPGFPYMEPCFAGTNYRNISSSANDECEPEDDQTDGLEGEYLSEKAALMGRTRHAKVVSGDHKPGWHKPLVGVVYEVTLADYAKIIATEGGGRGYRDGVIDCYPFPETYDPSDPVPDHPDTPVFKAHTLLSPAADNARLKSQSQKNGEVLSGGPKLSWWHTICLHLRPDPEHAQPSARYVGLIKAGAAEHNLPFSYQEYLAQVQTYHITTTRQKIGKGMFIALWLPGILSTMILSRLFAGPDGRSPPWLVALANTVGLAMWNSYDGFFAMVFGDGERTMDDTPA
ncbi:hypothetical protein N7457_002664 [Penicillium paradoxum]|uniref:uncharacterized protein n=1 Tax=Penicillium paradoxum TaxID=176176 RepID=UPI0025478FE3|nr:uncharacterized protein N7457_002664 [Penicillium paradoxum]KAJ5787674.1 hypothetical protein N7457_002664 [Penicillium paradoxum]